MKFREYLKQSGLLFGLHLKRYNKDKSDQLLVSVTEMNDVNKFKEILENYK